MNDTDYYQACDKYHLVKATCLLGGVMAPTDLGPTVDEECFVFAYDPLFVGLRTMEITHYRRAEHARNLMSPVEHLQKSGAAHFEVGR